MPAPRIRPPQPVFEALCRHYTRREIAAMHGVSVRAVTDWQRRYGLRAAQEKTGPKRRFKETKLP